ncbi:MAG: NTP transferase domain-containing protein [bacterium]|jgi:GTP:adenosylcobinamide-phosphate guanylyltransferase
MKYDLVVLAGGELDPATWGADCPPYKALLSLGGFTMLDIALRAFRGVPGINRRLVVGEGAEVGRIARSYGASTIPCGYGIVGNLRNATIELKDSVAPGLIVATSDIPLFTSESAFALVKAFDALALEYDFVYPVVPVHICRKLVPGTKRTSIKTKDGRFTGGNVFLLNRHALVRNFPFLDELVKHRKSPFKLASMIGAGTIFRVAAGIGSLSDHTKSFSRKIYGKVKAYVCEHAEIAVDVDSPEEYARISGMLGRP